VNEVRVVADEGGLKDSYVDDTYGLRGLRDVEFAIDVGAHIGGATVLLHELFPSAQLVAVECCPENIPCLRANVEGFATVVHAAVTYEPGDLVLASTVYEGCRTSGSSVVTTHEDWEQRRVPWTWDHDDYHLDARPLPRLTIEDLLFICSWLRLDLVKLDCEGSEISILRNCTCLASIGTIVGEYHDPLAFAEVAPRGTVTWDGHLFRTFPWTGVTC
jgi:FkbM family methyltransferase